MRMKRKVVIEERKKDEKEMEQRKGGRNGGEWWEGRRKQGTEQLSSRPYDLHYALKRGIEYDRNILHAYMKTAQCNSL
jgi:hypothetical protein